VTLIDEKIGEQAEQPLPEEQRRHPSTIGGALYIGVLLAMGTGLLLVWLVDWRVGVRVLSGALAGAAVFRLVLPQRDAGMLAVRSRWLDVLVVGGTAAVLFALAASIPNQPFG
jgi:hypothetical protein